MSIRKKTETGDIIIAGKGKDATGDFVVTPQVAEVGQVLVVKTVDENGKPTEWECSGIIGDIKSVLEAVL